MSLQSNGSATIATNGDLKRAHSEEQDDHEPKDSSIEELASIECSGQMYYIGDHIHGIQKHTVTGVVTLHIVLFSYPHEIVHPPSVQFFQNTVLKSTREVQVPVAQVVRPCFVVPSSDAVRGHPGSTTSGQHGPLYGAFIMKVKNRNRQYWPHAMTEERKQALSDIIEWAGGPRELEKLGSGLEDSGVSPRTRRSTRQTSAASTPTTQPPSTPLMSYPMATRPLANTQAFYQQMMQMRPNAMFVPGYHAHHRARRGRPPKNKQLILQREREAAAAAAAAAAGHPPVQPSPRVSARRQSAYGNAGRPPPSGLGSPQTIMMGHRSSIGHVSQAPAVVSMPGQRPQLPTAPSRPQPQPQKTAPLAHIDPSTIPQLPPDLVSLFPTSDGMIRWFATAPVCRVKAQPTVHSEQYLQWKNSNNSYCKA
ncbi:hypothetical protein DL89DRAFT_294209 [Linderina pennispora]|uniref:Uncharacterized protein n=1 Tax=Linderina pennispora TaxID=61395 RepID=A0A1Y1W4K1_9FUNG|nr:uncharacterized protein DL89DRAFT_294209 [Linderina pennispora]ORX68312.1 hypothetical protein DL89DRAFT_294209 [Linderina pennispora]